MNGTMDCKKFEIELTDLVMTPGATPSLGAVAHMKVCPPCTEEYLSFQATLSLLDSWQAPEPTPYFDQKLAVLLREEQAAPPMGWFERLTTRLRLNTGRGLRPAMVGALSLALVVGGGSIFLVPGPAPAHHPPVQASATVNDLEILERNEQAFQQTDALQQDEDSATDGGQTNQDAAPPSTPIS
jgi:hypothetical protein